MKKVSPEFRKELRFVFKLQRAFSILLGSFGFVLPILAFQQYGFGDVPVMVDGSPAGGVNALFVGVTMSAAALVFSFLGIWSARKALRWLETSEREIL